MQAHTIRLNPNDEIARQLNQQDQKPVYVEANGVRYRLVRETPAIKLTDDLTDYDPGQAQAALKASAGAFRTVDVEALKRDIWEAREQDSPGRPA